MSLESGYSIDLSVPAPADSRNIIGPDNSTRGVRELYVEYNRPRNRPRALQGERQCRRHRSKEREEYAAMEPERVWIFLEIVGDSKVSQVDASTAFFIWFSKMTTVDKHEYYNMIRAREERIRTFMQLELEACLEEVSWMLRCHNCEALDCPQEEYPARFLPTPLPSYIDNLQSRLIKARKGIFPASLKMILNTKYQLPPETSVQPDGMIGNIGPGKIANRQNAIHRRVAPRLIQGQRNPQRRRSRPRSIRGQRNPERRNSRPRSVRGQDPGHREPKRKWRKKFSLLKPVWMVFCVQISQAWSRSVLCFASQTSGSTTTRKNSYYYSTSRRSRGVRESYGEATGDNSLGNRAAQAIR